MISFPILADVIFDFLLEQLHQLRNESKHTGEYIFFFYNMAHVLDVSHNAVTQAHRKRGH